MDAASITAAVPRILHAAADRFAGADHPAARATALALRVPCPIIEGRMPEALSVLQHLPTALRCAGAGRLPDLLRQFAATFAWTTGDFMLPAGIANNNAYAELVGPAGPARRDDHRFGFYLQSPGCFYPMHAHAAEELYVVMSGEAEWQVEGHTARFLPPGTLIHHAPWQRHAVRTASQPLLAMWHWSGSISTSEYRVDAS